MSTSFWYKKLGSVLPYVFEILTPGGSGTGFQIFANDQGLCGIATAYHVIDHALDWEEPIKVIHHSSGKSLLLKQSSRAIFPYPEVDLAIIVFQKNDLPISSSPDNFLIDPQRNLIRGVEVGWLGFPSVAPAHELCFFAGHVSSFLKQGSYLVDGVAITGVSGGPAFYIEEDTNLLRICGVISAYVPSRSYGETLPGLCIFRSVEPYQEMLQRLKSFSEAEKKAEKQQKDVVQSSKPTAPEERKRTPEKKSDRSK